jgi:hypothetical protein
MYIYVCFFLRCRNMAYMGLCTTLSPDNIGEGFVCFLAGAETRRLSWTMLPKPGGYPGQCCRNQAAILDNPVRIVKRLNIPWWHGKFSAIIVQTLINKTNYFDKSNYFEIKVQTKRCIIQKKNYVSFKKTVYHSKYILYHSKTSIVSFKKIWYFQKYWYVVLIFCCIL